MKDYARICREYGRNFERNNIKKSMGEPKHCYSYENIKMKNKVGISKLKVGREGKRTSRNKEQKFPESFHRGK